MDKRIKTLYIITIAAITAFLGMQGYWLYSRYEYSLTEYQHHAEAVIADALVDYNTERVKNGTARVNSSFNLSHDRDSTGNVSRKVTVTSTVINGRKLLGITEDRTLTDEEIDRLANIVTDSLARVEKKKLSVDATSAPSDGVAWSAMQNFELEIQTPFTIEGLDSLLRKKNIDTKVSLTITDSLIWKSVTRSHINTLNPHFEYISPYSELERKAVVIDCRIPTADVVREMLWTLILSSILSLFLFFCLIWQIRTIVKLSRLDKMRNSFVSTMIHELKRPISTLKMCISGIDNERMMENREIKKEVITETRNALDNLSAYFSKLRDITFNNVEQIPLNIQCVNLRDLFDNVISATVVPPDKSVIINNNIDKDVEVSADRSHLYNILNNLLENAVKYSGREVEINATATVGNAGVRLTVSDTGNGIPSSDLKHIFKRFYRGKASSGEQPGMGLGLAYVKLLTEAHGGEITVDSTEGKGSCFTITLPQ